MRALPILSLMLVSCGPTYVYDVHCFSGADSVTMLSEVDVFNINKDIDFVIAKYAESGLLSKQDACDQLYGWTLHIRDEYEWWAASDAHGMKVDGITKHGDRTVELTRDMYALAHETIHVYENIRHINMKGDQHAGWSINPRYTYIMATYQDSPVPLTKVPGEPH